MHPDEETFETYLRDAFADVREAGEPKDPPGPAQERMQAVARAHLTPPSRRRAWLTAAAALLLVAGLLFRARLTSPQVAGFPALPAVPSAEGSRFRTPGPGVELLLSADARLAGNRLDAGGCLAMVQGGRFEIEIGSWKVLASAAEFVARIEPEPIRQASIWMRGAVAGEGARASLAVLSGQVELTGSGKASFLKAGEFLAEGRERTVLDAAHVASLREAFFAPLSVQPDPHAVGNAVRHGKGDGWRLSGSDRPSACLVPVPAVPYGASLRLRARSRPSALGLSARVGGEPVLLPLEDPRLWDGAWHRLGLLVTPNRVSVTLDGELLRRVPRTGFRPNPEAGLDGFGPAVWGGEIEVESLEVQALR
jgi:hypothetical protein